MGRNSDLVDVRNVENTVESLNPLQLGRNSDEKFSWLLPLLKKVSIPYNWGVIQTPGIGRDLALASVVSIPYNWGVIQTEKRERKSRRISCLNPLQLGRNSDLKSLARFAGLFLSQSPTIGA